MADRSLLSPEMRKQLEESDRLIAQMEQETKRIDDARYKQASDYQKRVENVLQKRRQQDNQ